MGTELFDNNQTRVIDLLNNVKNGQIGLPDLQRAFVWKDTKVRELLDSMMKGYPIGYIMLWAAPYDYDNKNYIGKNDKAYAQPTELVIDGQQRLTALLAAMFGVEVKDKNYKARKIRISFNPLTKEFAVWSQAYEKNAEWISEISSVFQADADHTISRFRKNHIKDVNVSREKKGETALTEEEEDIIEENINCLLNLLTYTLPTLKISARASEEEVADIFVRVNSGGQNLTEQNFIETLLAVYDNGVHESINNFCASSRIPENGTAYNPIMQVDPSHLIRMSVGLGFRRARLRYAYMLLRGKDLTTGEMSGETREANLLTFKEALNKVTNLNNWHAFMNLFAKAGYLNKSIVPAKSGVVFGYVLYLVGKYDYKVPIATLNKIMTKWIFMITITSYYSSSQESEVERHFADLRSVHTADEFVAYLDSIISNVFTEDYFAITLPMDLNTSSAVSPTWYGYIAALNVLGTPVLFGTAPLAQYFVPGTSGTKNAIDKHHIFPKNYLAKLNIVDDRERNQIANFAYLDYDTNIAISDAPPEDYVKRFRETLGEDKYIQTCKQNALPENFESLDYADFLVQRRLLMAQRIKKAYMELCK